ncbi:MAG: hypothetical protein ABWY27_00975 [Telluria sp.]
MSGTLRTCYRGWNIAVRCLSKRAPAARQAGVGTHTATARASLNDTGSCNEWIDPRPQTVMVLSRDFDTHSHCSQAVLAEIKILIDGLKR